jgi:NCS1 family nucleobase:cation symporter-1
MASYSIVLAPVAALMAIDFFVIKKQRLDIYELYKPDGIYRFTRGWNWRSYVALACAIAPNLPGMIAAINANVTIGNVKYIYMISNIAGDFSESGVQSYLRFPFCSSQLPPNRFVFVKVDIAS